MRCTAQVQPVFGIPTARDGCRGRQGGVTMGVYKVGRMDTALHGEFLEPPRDVFVYFTSEDNDALGAGVCRIPPGSSNAEHAHDDADEVIYVIAGSMRIVCDGEEILLNRADAVFVGRGVVHQIFNASRTEEVIHTFTFNPPHPSDAIGKGYGNDANFKIHHPAGGA